MPNSVIELSHLDIQPMPLIVPGTAEVTMRARTMRTINDMKVEVRIERMMFGDYGIKMPCISGIGSW